MNTEDKKDLITAILALVLIGLWFIWWVLKWIIIIAVAVFLVKWFWGIF